MDLGCGTSPLAARMAQEGFGEVVAVDFSSEAIALMRANFANSGIKLVECDAQELGNHFRANYFDIVVCKATIDSLLCFTTQEGYCNAIAAMLEIWKVMKPKGSLICFTINAETVWTEMLLREERLHNRFRLVRSKRQILKGVDEEAVEILYLRYEKI